MPYNELHEYCKGVPTEAGLEERLSRDPKAGLEQDETGKTPLHYLCANYSISVQLIATYLKHAPEAARIEANEKAREAAAAEEAEYEEEAEEGDDDEEEIALVTFDADDDVAHATRSWLKREGFWREGDLCSVGHSNDCAERTEGQRGVPAENAETRSYPASECREDQK